MFIFEDRLRNNPGFIQNICHDNERMCLVGYWRMTNSRDSALPDRGQHDIKNDIKEDKYPFQDLNLISLNIRKFF